MSFQKLMVLSSDERPTLVAFDLGDRAKIDGDVTVLVVGIAVYPSSIEYKVSWWNNGALLNEWVADWRLSVVPAC